MDMSLRLTLLLIGLVLLGIIIYDSWRRVRRHQLNKRRAGVIEEALVVEHFSATDDELQEGCPKLSNLQQAEQQNVFSQSTSLETSIEKSANHYLLELSQSPVIVFHIMPLAGHTLSGATLLPALLTLGLRYDGQQQLFHYYLQHSAHQKNEQILFSVASATEPGVFDLQALESQQFAGIMLLLQRENVGEAFHLALQMMAQTAQRLAQMLEGEVCDQQRQPLTQTQLAGLLAEAP